MVNHDWPGNVRELMNVIERAVLLSSGPQITPSLLPPEIARAANLDGEGIATSTALDSPKGLPAGWEDRSWREVREEALSGLETAYLAGQLALAEGRIGKAAARAGMTTRSLHEKMVRLGLRKDDFR
jgi:DNA-binding NtrC family response regulator